MIFFASITDRCRAALRIIRGGRPVAIIYVDAHKSIQVSWSRNFVKHCKSCSACEAVGLEALHRLKSKFLDFMEER